MLWRSSAMRPEGRTFLAVLAVSAGVWIGLYLAGSHALADHLDDVVRETHRVMQRQGRGWWVNCQLAAEINRDALRRDGIAYTSWIVRIRGSGELHIVTLVGDRLLDDLHTGATTIGRAVRFEGYDFHCPRECGPINL